MKQSTRFNITVGILTVILVLSIGLFIKVYRANQDNGTEQATTSAQTTETPETTTVWQSESSSTTETEKPGITET